MKEVVIEITPEIQALLDDVPDKHISRARKWTKDEDDMLLVGWNIKRRDALAAKIGVAYNTALGRYRFLTEVQNGHYESAD